METLCFLVLPSTCYHLLLENHFTHPALLLHHESVQPNIITEPCSETNGSHCSFYSGEYHSLFILPMKDSLIALLCTTIFFNSQIELSKLLSLLLEHKQKIWEKHNTLCKEYADVLSIMQLIAMELLDCTSFNDMLQCKSSPKIMTNFVRTTTHNAVTSFTYEDDLH